ncbi:MAG TPA: prepilin-type N-terminal cleavage/methylation domain-containing protein [Verrucomicrobiae bacterium]|nr:prepilin-type N-terminal cleavage/methylation domain-containing protein [Verrucomicrobiae bacterium]
MNIPKPHVCTARRFEKAFTLAELMVACAILAIMVVSLFGGISFGFSNITIARQNLRATQIALEKMEIVRMYSWEQVNSNGFVPTSFTAPFFPSVSGSDTNGGVTYYGVIQIDKIKLGATYDDDMREIFVRLNWTNKNVAQSLEMSTYISQYGMHRYIY